MVRLRRFYVPGPDGNPLVDGIAENTYLRMASFNRRSPMVRGRRPDKLTCWVGGMELHIAVGERVALFGPKAVVTLIYNDTDPILVLSSDGQALNLPFNRSQVTQFFAPEKTDSDDDILLPAAEEVA